MVWESLSEILESNVGKHFLLGGDFNAILRPSDKSGGVGWNNQKQKDFSDFVFFNGLMEVPFKRGEFTWNNRCSGFSNIAEKLDRILLWGDWDRFPWLLQAEILPITGSDHYPIYARIHEDEVPERCPFKFEKMWLREARFLDMVAGWWKEATQRFGNKAFIFFKKLQFIKEKLKQWNREVFKNIFSEKLID